MEESYEVNISQAEKAQIASDFLLSAPPGEFNEVFNDVRILVDDDELLKAGTGGAFSAYNLDQFTQVTMPDGSKTLITSYGDIGEGRFFDPRSGQSFSFDHLKKVASDFQPHTVDCSVSENRSQLESLVDEYVKEFYTNSVATVYGQNDKITICIEGHKYNPNNFWNGQWRSLYTWNADGVVNGKLKVQVHYYENGNVELKTDKDVTFHANSAKSVIENIKKEDSEFQTGINENFITMSDVTFKALRRALPVTKSKLDWSKIINYNIGKEFN